MSETLATSLSIVLVPKTDICSNFQDKNGHAGPKTIIIVPYRISRDEKDALITAWGCSLANECEFTPCFYSKVKRVDKQEYVEVETRY